MKKYAFLPMNLQLFADPAEPGEGDEGAKGDDGNQEPTNNNPRIYHEKEGLVVPKITNVKFLSLEFDFGYYEDNEETHENKGNIDAEVFVEIESGGEIAVTKHKTNLKDVSFADFMSTEDMEEIVTQTGSLAEYIQTLRKVIMLKVANELGMEVADVDYTPAQPLGEKVQELETGLLEMTAVSAMQEQKATENEQAILELSMLIAGGAE